MWWILLILGCNDASEQDENPDQLDIELVSAVSWQQRAKALETDLSNVLVMAESGQREDAKRRLRLVYETSYEAELEVAIRRHLSPKKAQEIEFLFGNLMEGFSKSRQRKMDLKRLLIELSKAANSLDEKAAARSSQTE